MKGRAGLGLGLLVLAVACLLAVWALTGDAGRAVTPTPPPWAAERLVPTATEELVAVVTRPPSATPTPTRPRPTATATRPSPTATPLPPLPTAAAPFPALQRECGRAGPPLAHRRGGPARRSGPLRSDRTGCRLVVGGIHDYRPGLPLEQVYYHRRARRPPFARAGEIAGVHRCPAGESVAGGQRAGRHLAVQ